MYSREQRWAQKASLAVRTRENEPWSEDYGRQCLRLPCMIHECGLCQTLAFLEAKGQDADETGGSRRPYFHALLEDLARALEVEAAPGTTIRRSLSDKARTSPITEYQRLSRDALGCANYLKRYAEAILRVQPGVDDEPAREPR